MKCVSTHFRYFYLAMVDVGYFFRAGKCVQGHQSGKDDLGLSVCNLFYNILDVWLKTASLWIKFKT